MKKKLVAFIAAILLGGLLPTGHVHDANCGYNSETNSGCMYEISLMQQEETGH